MPSGIVLPERLSNMDISAAASSSSKGKGKATVKREIKKEEDDLDDSTTNSGTMTSTQGGGDRADAIAKTQAGERFLKAIRDTWDDHCACMSKVRDVLKYVVSRYM
jgi:cullin 3